MSWNYRVVRTDFVYDGTTTPVFSVHRCYYAKSSDTLPVKYGAVEASPEGETLDELRVSLHQMMEALEKPILTPKGNRLVEYAIRKR